MKRSPLPSPILLLLISVLFIASASQNLQARDKDSSADSGAIFANTASEGGHLLIARSPTLGRNVTITLKIDGKLAGSLGWGRTYDRYITPGRHILTASATRTSGAWQATLDVRAGQTYSYSAAYSVDRLVLTPRTR
jgi:hypothetical protein